MKKITFTKSEISLAIIQSKSYQDMFKYLGLKGSGHHYRIIHRLIKEYNLDDATKHFLVKGGIKVKHLKANVKYHWMKY